MIELLSELAEPGWAHALTDMEPTIRHIGDFLHAENTAGRPWLPASYSVLHMFTIPFDFIKVLIVGQDPYPAPGYPVGLSFCVAPNAHPLPKSLINTYKELVGDLEVPAPINGDLTSWMGCGVMLLNKCLTVGVGRPNSYQGKGWGEVTETVIRVLSARMDADGKPRPLVAILWGHNV